MQTALQACPVVLRATPGDSDDETS